MSSILSALSGSTHESAAIWVELPPGYVPLPLINISEHMSEAGDLIEELSSDEYRPVVAPLVNDLTFLLQSLAARNGLYCGIARHIAEDGTPVSSSLVVALQQYPEKVNPRVLLKDLVLKKSENGELGQADLVDVQGRPMLFFEHDRELPTPHFPGQPDVPEGSTSQVFQLEALIPSEDGSKLVSIEFSTPVVAHGPEFRTMIVMMAASVSFDPPAPSVESAPDEDGVVRHRSIADALNG